MSSQENQPFPWLSWASDQAQKCGKIPHPSCQGEMERITLASQSTTCHSGKLVLGKRLPVCSPPPLMKACSLCLNGHKLLAPTSSVISLTAVYRLQTSWGRVLPLCKDVGLGQALGGFPHSEAVWHWDSLPCAVLGYLPVQVFRQRPEHHQ